MVATTAGSSFFSLPSQSSDTSGKISRSSTSSIAACGARTKSNSTSSGRLQVKTNAQVPSKVNGTKVGLNTDDEVTVLRAPRTFINLLPDWSMLLATITTVFLAAEKQWMMLDSKPKWADMLVDPYGFGRIVKDGYVFRQNFSIRSYEIGADRTASIETLMNHLQETAINHVRCAGLLANGFGSTPEMCKRNLIWVVSKMRVLVDRYPQWGDVVQLDTWVAAAGKNGMRRDWLMQDSSTGDTLLRATSVWVMMNKETRKLSKIPDEVRNEIGGYFVDTPPLVDDDDRKLPKLDDTADYIHTGLTPRWNDLDLNQHVNNVKYIGWILESAPLSILEKHELAAITLEYRRECTRDSTVESLTSVISNDDHDSGGGFSHECQHLLRLECSRGEIVKGRTSWRPKNSNK